MKPILRACLSARDSRGFTLDCGDEAAMRIVALAADLVRVTALRGGEVRQKRTWAVPAYGGEDTDWFGRARLDDSSWPAVATEITSSPAKVAMDTRALRLSVTLDGFRMDWALPDGTIFARDREMQPYFLGQETHAFKHAMARAPGDRHYGLGDKTGPLDLTGRRLRCAMRDGLGFDPERGDPLYKNWPFLIVRDAASGIAHGVFYDNAAEGAFDFGCEHDNYFGRYRAYEAEDGDLDFYLILGPRLANVTAKFVALTGRTALPPRWSLGFAQTAMALADPPDAEARIRGVIDAAKALDIPISSFHFGSGYTSIGTKRYVFTWNRTKFPEPKALTRAFADADMKVVANVKPCLLGDHPHYGEVAAAGGFIAGSDDHAPLKSQFWDGEGAHIDFTHPAGVAWWKENLTRQVLGYGVDAGWNDNNEYGLWDDDAICAGFGEPTPPALLRPVQALLMTRATREAQLTAKPNVRPFTITRAGARSLNIELQAALNPAGERKVERFGWTFAPSDKVMQIENDYDKEVYNGDIGYVVDVDPEAGELVTSFDGRSVTYGFGELDRLVPAYAATIHKSQGSEYPAVVIPVLTQHHAMLQRNLLYTGITRGKRLVVLVGQKKAIAIAVRNVSGRRRWSKLDQWLRLGASRATSHASKAG